LQSSPHPPSNDEAGFLPQAPLLLSSVVGEDFVEIMSPAKAAEDAQESKLDAAARPRVVKEELDLVPADVRNMRIEGVRLAVGIDPKAGARPPVQQHEATIGKAQRRDRQIDGPLTSRRTTPAAET